MKAVEEKTSRVFPEGSYKALTVLSQDKNEDACFVFEKEFGKIFTSFLKENNICEMYLFDRQGSCLFLDESAHLSWFIMRSEKGMENSIQKSIQHHAPKEVTEALKTKQYVLKDSDHKLKKFYYAFIKDFPGSEIDKSNILSYQAFLNQAS